jgi:hypothetical protein
VPDAPPDFVTRVRRFLAHRLFRYAVCWLACLGLAAARWHHAYHSFDSAPTNDESSAADRDRVRDDGNSGHTWIDFGGQWVFGRTAAEGRWRELYHRDDLRRTADVGYPIHRQSPAVQKWSAAPDKRPPDLKPDDVRTDADRLLRSMMGDDVEDKRNERLGEVVGAAFAGQPDNPLAVAAYQLKADEFTADDQAADKPLLGRPVLGGPLYPPVHALLYAPLGAVENSQRAYYLFQLFSVVCVFGSGLAIRALSRGRVWWPVATTLLFLFPGMRPGIDLGQNHALTLFIILGGWAIAARLSQFGGGLVWGLLAFKPVWGVAFILAPILLRKWRMVLGVGVCGCSLCLVTLPLVGVEGWKEWLHIGGEAADLYNRDENWINLSRDVSGLPKRLYVDFTAPKGERTPPWVNLTCNLLLGTVGVVTAAVGVFGGGTARRLWRVAGMFDYRALPVYLSRGYGLRFTGLRAGFILLGCYLCCYRFMYYDAVMASVGFAALLAYPKWTLAGWQGELREAAQPASRRRVFLFASSAPASLLLLLLLADNVLLNTGGMMTVANDHWLRPTPDPSATQTRKGEGDAVVTEPKTKWVPRQLSVRMDYSHAVDTYLVLAAWAWCGWRLLRDGRRVERLSTRDPPEGEKHPPGG